MKEDIIEVIVTLVSPFVILGILYLIAKKYPKLSRELHKRNCHCKVCYPVELNK